MGNDISKEEESQKRHQQHEQRVRDDYERKRQEAERRKRALEETNQQRLTEARHQNEREVEAEAKRSLAQVDAEIERLQELKRKHDNDLFDWRERANMIASQENAQMEASARIEQDRRRVEFENESARLRRCMEELENARTNLLEIFDRGNKVRAELQAEHNERTARQRSEHAEYLLAANASLNRYRTERQNDLRVLAENGRAEQQALMDTRLELETRCQCAQVLMDAMKTDNGNENVRLACDRIRMHFRMFKEVYNTQEPVLANVEREMRRKRRLTKLPELEIINESYAELLRVVEAFVVPENFEGKFGEPLERVKSNMREINDAMDECKFYVEEYLKFMQMPPDDDKFKALEECSIQLKEWFGKIRVNLNTLSKTITIFEIPVSAEVIKEIQRQAGVLEISSQRQIDDSIKNRDPTDHEDPSGPEPFYLDNGNNEIEQETPIL